MLTQYRLNNEIAQLMRKRAGAYVRGLRQDARLTQQQVAKALGYDYYTMISQIEIGRTRVPPEDYARWAQILGVAVNEFARNMLSFVDPFTYHAIFGGEHPIAVAQREAVKNAKRVRSSDSSGERA